jgi:hypothetical protein
MMPTVDILAIPVVVVFVAGSIGGLLAFLSRPRPLKS